MIEVIGVQRLSVIVPKEERKDLSVAQVAELHEGHTQHLPVPAGGVPDGSILQGVIDRPH